jgi:hypothetical protein
MKDNNNNADIRTELSMPRVPTRKVKSLFWFGIFLGFIILLVTSLIIFKFGKTSQYPSSNIISSGETIIKRIKTPSNFDWIIEDKNSFGEFVQNISLEPNKSKILDYKGNPISNQAEHVAIMKFDVGSKDLQQCADAVIRIRAEYLFSLARYDEIGFHFTSGDFFKWNDYRNGYRPIVSENNSVTIKKTNLVDSSYKNFRKYLDVIYSYSGTISLYKETKKVNADGLIKTGDILITPGSPGHAVIIVGRAKSKINGEIIYLLAEGYTPAQSIHIITNPYNAKINPWYKLSTSNEATITARYMFTKTDIRTF